MPGKKFHHFSQTHASAQPYLAACSGWLQPEVPGPPSCTPSIHEAPATRKHAARLVRVAYHMARCWMGAPGWTSRWSVVAGAAQLLSLPQQQQQQAEQGQASHLINTARPAVAQRSDLSNHDGVAKPAAFSTTVLVLLFTMRLCTIDVAIHGRSHNRSLIITLRAQSYTRARWRLPRRSSAARDKECTAMYALLCCASWRLE